MTVFEVLRRKHRELDVTFDAIERTESFVEADAQYRELATRIVAYLRAERAVVVPRLRLDPHEVGQVGRHHDRIEAAVDHLRLGALDEATWRSGVRALREQLEDLGNLEEWILFPFATLSLTTDELAAIAEALQAFEPAALRLSAVTITYDPPAIDVAEPAPLLPPVAYVPPLFAAADTEPGIVETTIRVPREEPPANFDFDFAA